MPGAVSFGRAATAAAAITLVASLLPAGVCAAVDHQPWDALVARSVDDGGRVAYKDLAAKDRAALDRYLTTLANADLDGMSAPAEKAFWINAYNAGVVSAVLDGYCAEGILSRRSLFRRYSFPVAAKKRTLDEIEHQILRPRFRDPRVHFAVVCASTSCPRLRRGAYTEANVEVALGEEARRFVNDPTRHVIDPAAERVQLSAIFD